MPLITKDLDKKEIRTCIKCRSRIDSTGYQCNVCGLHVCVACGDSEYKDAHEHPGAVPMSDPDKLEKALVQDQLLAAEIHPSASSSSQHVPCLMAAVMESEQKMPLVFDPVDVCPSCRWDRKASSLDSRLSFLVRNDKPLNNYELNKATAGGSDAHCVVPQNVLSSATRAFLNTLGEGGPCDVLRNWDTVSVVYKEAMLKACNADVQTDIAKELQAVRRFGLPATNQKTAGDLKSDWVRPAKLTVREEEVPISLSSLLSRYTSNQTYLTRIRELKMDGNPAQLTDMLSRSCVLTFGYSDNKAKIVEAVTLDVDLIALNPAELTEKQKEKKNNFLRMLGSERRTAKPSEVLKDGILSVTVKIAGDGENYVEYNRWFDRSGTIVQDTARDVINGEAGDLRNIEKVIAPPKAYPDTVFVSLMRKKLTVGNQCAYCELVQGPHTLPQRLSYFIAHPDTPVEFVGISLLAAIEKEEGIDPYMRKWLDNAVIELEVDLVRLCKKEQAVMTSPQQASSSSSSVSSPKAMKASEKPKASEEEMKKAILDGMPATASFTYVDVLKNAGAIISKLDKKQDNATMKRLIEAYLKQQEESGKISLDGKTYTWIR